MPLLFAAALFVSAFLLFWVQPLVGKMVLPLLGGTPAVWNTCMLFFQALLLAGYAYALAVTRWLSGRAQAVTHVALLVVAALALPPAIDAATASGAPEGGSPAWWLLKTLLVTVGPPFLVLSASAPLLQRWFSRTRDASASDPYFLYAASNAGSLFALLGFPFLLEPSLTLGQQGRGWALAYGALALLIAACAVAALRSRATNGDAPAVDSEGEPAAGRVDGEPAAKSFDERAADENARPVSWGRRLWWVLLAFVPSSLVLGVTTYVTTDLAAVPLLWVIPLALYLLSFVVVFARRRPAGGWLPTRLLPGAAVLLAFVYLSGATEPAWFLIVFHLLFLFCVSLMCHGRLADDRPAASHLAEFYLCLAAGGVLGGLLNALVAPVAFDTLVEYPLVILLASYLRPGYRRRRGRLLGLRLGARRAEAPPDPNADALADDEDDARPGALDFLLPLLLGLLTAALMLAVEESEMAKSERVALSLGVPLFLLNHFFAPRPLRFTLGLGAVFLASALLTATEGRTLHAARNFYGTHRVLADDADTLHWLRHGSTLHGKQYTDAARRCEPLSYYHRNGPLGSVFEALRARATTADVKEGHAARPSAPRAVAVVGLGAGTTAAYARPGEAWTFYEIDPAVVRVARNPAFFTYLSECARAPVAVVVGDARLRLREAAEGAYDLIALDAFSSDAVPAHLLTREALALYLSKLAPGGVIAFHVSNRNLEIERVVGGISAEAGLHARIFNDGHDPDAEGGDPGRDASTWVAVARAPEDLGALATDERWPALDASTHRLEPWRDDFSDVLGVFRWR